MKNVGTFIIIILGLACSNANATVGKLGTPPLSHNYKFGDFLNYTSWDFKGYQKAKKSNFSGYCYNDKLNKTPYLHFQSKSLNSKIDRRKLIPLDVSQNSIAKINQFFLAGKTQNKDLNNPPSTPTPSTYKPQRKIVNSAGGYSFNPQENKNPLPYPQEHTPLVKKPISPEDILLLINKKSLNASNNNSNKVDLLIPFEVPNSQQRIIPSQAIYTQE